MNKAGWLDWRDEIPYNTEFEDSYYSHHGGFDEARHVYVNGLGLASHAAAGRDFTLAELGFGTGLNFLSSVREWQASNGDSEHGTLHYIAVEKRPLSRAELCRAWKKFSQITDVTSRAAQLLAPLAQGFQRIWWSRSIVLDLWVGDVDAILPYWCYQIDGWYLDGFAPSRNPQMFSPAVLDHVKRLSHAGSEIASFTVAGQIRRGLAERGFTVIKRQGFGHKSHCLYAQARSLPAKASPDHCRIAVIGAGIAGASVAHQLKYFAPSAEIILFDAGEAASQVPLAAVAPRLSATNTPRGQLLVSSLRYARQFYDLWSPSAWVGAAGAMKLPGPALDEKRLQRAVDTWAEWGVEMCDAASSSDRSGLSIDVSAQWLDEAGIIETKILLHNLQKTSDRFIRAKVKDLIALKGDSAAGWRLRGVRYHGDSTEAYQLDVDRVVLACGAGSNRLCPEIAAFSRVKSASVAYHSTLTPPTCALGGWGGHALSDSDAAGFWYGVIHNQQGLPRALHQLGYEEDEHMMHRHRWTGKKLSINAHIPIAGVLSSPQNSSQAGCSC